MKKSFAKRRFVERKQKFKPDRKFIAAETEKFLKAGGKITRIDELPEMKDYMDRNAVYDFLMGE